MPRAAPAGASEQAAFFSRFPVVVLVANSEAVRIDEVASAYGESALYVFFNKVYKVLDRPFSAPSLLVARSGTTGANIVHRREVGEVLGYFGGADFNGILNIRAGGRERFSEPAEFGIDKVGHLDLAPTMKGFYPATHLPTSGFALALFLAETCPATRIVLAGFTAQRSARWRLFEDHDWTFEQIVLRLMARTGRLEIAPGSPGRGEEGPLSAIVRRLDGVSSNDVALVAGEVLAERLDGANSAIDRLTKLTRAQGRLRDFVRRFKPKTRKDRLTGDRGEGA